MKLKKKQEIRITMQDGSEHVIKRPVRKPVKGCWPGSKFARLMQKDEDLKWRFMTADTPEERKAILVEKQELDKQLDKALVPIIAIGTAIAKTMNGIERVVKAVKKKRK